MEMNSITSNIAPFQTKNICKTISGNYFFGTLFPPFPQLPMRAAIKEIPYNMTIISFLFTILFPVYVNLHVGIIVER